MKRANPLFVDSTKFNGDQILTRLQLRAPYVEPGTGFVIEIERPSINAENLRIALMRDEEDDVWRGQIHLEHLEGVRVTPVMIDSFDQEIKGGSIECLGTHVIDLTWDIPEFKIQHIDVQVDDALLRKLE